MSETIEISIEREVPCKNWKTH